MPKKFITKSKVIAKQLAIAFFFSTFIIFLTAITIGIKVDKKVSKLNGLFTIGYYNEESETRDIKIDKIKKRLTNYPYYGEAFATLEIPSVDISVTVYHGEGLEVLKYGLGHHTGSYFPGEGGRIIIAGHNTWGQFYTLPNVKVGDKVIIKTSYGKYTYEITKTEIANAKLLGNNLKLTTDIENIMLYTCYPLTPGYKTDRFVVYGNLVGEEHE